jgi:hypothetical protein
MPRSYATDEMLFPNRPHALSEGRGITVHRWRTVIRYIYERLPP